MGKRSLGWTVAGAVALILAFGSAARLVTDILFTGSDYWHNHGRVNGFVGSLIGVAVLVALGILFLVVSKRKGETPQSAEDGRPPTT